jgi:hypothetical protein
MPDHAFTARTPSTEAVRRLPSSGLFEHFGIRGLPDTQSRRDQLRPRSLQRVLKVAILREDIAERFVHHIVGGDLNENGILIDLDISFIKPDHDAALAVLRDFEQWHIDPPCSAEFWFF